MWIVIMTPFIFDILAYRQYKSQALWPYHCNQTKISKANLDETGIHLALAYITGYLIQPEHC